MIGCFVTGTDTSVGKTLVSCTYSLDHPAEGEAPGAPPPPAHAPSVPAEPDVKAAGQAVTNTAEDAKK